MDQPTRTYRAICFDLDGTLLPMDIDAFMGAYFKRIAAFMGAHGVDADLFMKGLMAGTKAMATHTDGRVNADVFWDTFYGIYGGTPEERERVLALATRFYTEEFPHIGDDFEAPPAAANVVRMLKEKGYPLLLTTMPMFPQVAVEHRLGWAGVDPASFERITHYENSKSVKPHQTYFAENLAAMGLSGNDVLMVGNNTMEDFAFLDLGVEPYLITDWLLNPIDLDVNTLRHGTMEEFEAWVAALPQCTDPVESVETGVISHEAMEAALEANAVREIDLEDAADKAAQVADAVAGDHEIGSVAQVKITR